MSLVKVSSFKDLGFDTIAAAKCHNRVMNLGGAPEERASCRSSSAGEVPSPRAYLSGGLVVLLRSPEEESQDDHLAVGVAALVGQDVVDGVDVLGLVLLELVRHLDELGQVVLLVSGIDSCWLGYGLGQLCGGHGSSFKDCGVG